MRLRYIVLALFAAFSALGAIAFFGFPQEKPPASMNQGAPEYTTTALLEAASKWAKALPQICLAE